MVAEAMNPQEAYPSQDERRKPPGQNLASDEALCKAVADFLNTDYWWPYYIQRTTRQQTSWQRADNAWRGRIPASDMALPFASVKPSRMGGGVVSPDNGIDSRITPAAAHKQLQALLDMYCSTSFANGEVPAKFKRPKAVFETETYNPNQQAVDAANTLIETTAEEIKLPLIYRTAAGAFLRYGFVAAVTDLACEYEDVADEVPLPADPAGRQMLLNQRGMPEQVVNTATGQVAIYPAKKVKRFTTNLTPLRPEQLWIDQLIPACPTMDRQPAPFVNSHITRGELIANRYDENNPYGWLNIEKALSGDSQYVLSQPTETQYAERLRDKFGITDNAAINKPKNTIRQLWTCYPLLSIDPATGKLDTGEGFDCQCVDSQDCPQCGGTKKYYVKPERYVVQLYGEFGFGNKTTVLRIQRNPTAKDRVPIIFATGMPEDTTGAIPISKTDVAWDTLRELTKCRNQVLEAKEKAVNRPWLKRIDSPAWTVDCNDPDAVIPFDVNASEAQRVPGNTYDETTTLLPHINMLEGEIISIFGVTPTLMGQVAQGRRSASEINTVADASRVPIVAAIDSFNLQFVGGWAQMLIDNVEEYGDRDWIKRMTGRTTFGRLQLIAKTAEDFVRKRAVTQNAQYLLQATANDAAMQAIRPELYAAVLDGFGLEIDRSKLDGGLKKAQQDGFTIIARILGEGQFLPAQADDPHGLYVDMFSQAIKDEYWLKRAPQNIPLLMQRLQMQLQFQQQELMMRAQMEAQEQQAESQQGREAGFPPNQPETSGQEAQFAQG